MFFSYKLLCSTQPGMKRISGNMPRKSICGTVVVPPLGSDKYTLLLFICSVGPVNSELSDILKLKTHFYAGTFPCPTSACTQGILTQLHLK